MCRQGNISVVCGFVRQIMHSEGAAAAGVVVVVLEATGAGMVLVATAGAVTLLAPAWDTAAAPAAAVDAGAEKEEEVIDGAARAEESANFTGMLGICFGCDRDRGNGGAIGTWLSKRCPSIP
jgi:hypothetical protein